ncbi:7fold_repeat in clathrin and VPS proteins repeat-containing protein [Hexamita inflata]|uniref:7fold repeat in clathrin and VPS proteins repeat-containing protein n=1 Tax=Hexamita inflata TaxID=28002 RepID=A0AA86V1Y8_9EUKA|nr:7fold repeat in clathrin and VPS proteins repeat-containing protein [Hexamita inflata]
MSYDIFGEPLHGAIIPVTGPVLEFKPASSTLLALPSYILTTKSQSFLLKPATVDNHLKYLLEQNKYQTALRAAMVLKGFMGEEWSKMLPFCENQVVEYDNQLENLYEGVLQPLAVQQKYYAYVQPHTYQIGVDLERRYKMVKREDRKQSSKDNDTMTVIPEYITKQQLIPKKINIKTLLQSIVTTFLLQNQPGEAAGLLQNFLVADDQLWTQLSLQFGLSQNFRDLLPLLPIPEEHSRLPIISLTLATNFDSFVKLILKWKQDAFPQALMNILLPITQQVNSSSDISIAGSILSYLSQDYIQCIKYLVSGYQNNVKVQQLFSIFGEDLVQRGNIDKNWSSQQINVDTALIKELIVNCDCLFEINANLAARIFARFLTRQEQILEVFITLLIGVLKKINGVQINQQLSKQEFGGDMRVVRVLLSQYLCVYKEQDKQIMPSLEIIKPIFEFLWVILQNHDESILNCLSDNKLSLQDFLITYTPLVNQKVFTDVLQKCQSTNYRNTLMLCKDFTDLETMLRYVVLTQNRQSQDQPEIQAQLYQTALEITLERGSVSQAIQFIRRIQDVNSSNTHQMRILRQAGLWRFLTKHLVTGKGVCDLLDLLSKENVPIDVQEVIDLLQTDQQDDNLNEVLCKLVNSLRLLQCLQNDCADLIKQDCVEIRGHLVHEAKRACAVHKCVCSFCEQRANSETSGELNAKVIQDIRCGDFVVFNCGHYFHFQCLENAFQDDEWVCMVCAAKQVV